jgi:hypothetical protein
VRTLEGIEKEDPHPALSRKRERVQRDEPTHPFSRSREKVGMRVFFFFILASLG